MMMALVLMALGGAVGAMLRFVVDAMIRQLWSARFPVATLIINTTGSLALGLITAGATPGGADPVWCAALGVGLCGGFTTFSTAMVETVRLLGERRGLAGLTYLLGSAVVCVVAVGLGSWLGTAWWS